MGLHNSDHLLILVHSQFSWYKNLEGGSYHELDTYTG